MKIFIERVLFALFFVIVTIGLHTTGQAQSALDGFDPNANGVVRAVVVQPDGKILIGGDFTTVLGVTRNRIARLNTDGTLDTAFDPNASGPVSTIAVQADGKVLAGGAFTNIGGQTRNSVARLTNDTPAFSTLAVTQNTLTLTRDGSAPQFSRVIFEQSTDNGATWTLLGTATNSFASSVVGKNANPFAPNAVGYTLGGQNIPTGQNVLIRARGFYNAGFQNGSATTEDKVRNVFLLIPSAANVSVGGRVLTNEGESLRNANVYLTDSLGNTRKAQTGAFGNFAFEGIEAGQTVTIFVAAKRYRFEARIVQVNDNVTDIALVALP